jgi:hypothetical protein
LPNGFTFHDRSHVEAALAAATDGNVEVALITPMGGAASVGPEVYLEMYRGGHARFPNTKSTAMIDCGDDAGMAMRALRCGWRHLVFTGRHDVRQKLQDIAGQLDGRMEPSRPPTIDLLAARDPVKTVEQALSSSVSN